MYFLIMYCCSGCMFVCWRMYTVSHRVWATLRRCVWFTGTWRPGTFWWKTPAMWRSQTSASPDCWTSMRQSTRQMEGRSVDARYVLYTIYIYILNVSMYRLCTNYVWIVCVFPDLWLVFSGANQMDGPGVYPPQEVHPPEWRVELRWVLLGARARQWPSTSLGPLVSSVFSVSTSFNITCVIPGRDLIWHIYYFTASYLFVLRYSQSISGYLLLFLVIIVYWLLIKNKSFYQVNHACVKPSEWPLWLMGSLLKTRTLNNSSSSSRCIIHPLAEM